MMEEQADVLARERLVRFVSPPTAERARQLFQQSAAHFDAGSAPGVCRDKNDDFLLGLAEASQADYLVTRDADLLVLQRHGVTEIIYPARFLQLLGAAKPEP